MGDTGFSSSAPMPRGGNVIAKSNKQASSQEQKRSDAFDQTLSGLVALRNKIFRVIRDRLSQRGVVNTRLEMHVFNWFLPKDEDLADEWNALLDDPLATPLAVVEKLFDLRHSDRSSVVQGPEVTIFYVRTFSFTKDELLHVLMELRELREVDYPKSFVWIERLEPEHHEAEIHLRYCGMTTGMNAYQRHDRDIHHFYKPSSFMNFLHVTDSLYPDIVQSAKVQEFCKATFEFNATRKTHMSLREQMIIAIFGDSVLNTEAGGSDNPWTPGTDDREIFRSLMTNVKAALPANTTVCDASHRANVLQYAGDCQKYANSNAFTTGAEKYTFTNALKEVTREQGLFRTMKNGFGILSTISSDRPIQMTRNPRNFWIEKSRATNFSASTINYFGAWENPFGEMVDTYAEELTKLHHLPFVDLYPWTKKSSTDFSNACRLLRNYLQIANPIAVMTQSHHVSSTAWGSFQNPNGIPKASFVELVGTLSIRAYDHPGGEHNEQNCTIVIPSFHPGAISYSGTGDEAARVYFMTNEVGWLTMHETLQRSESSLSKREICEEVMRSVKLSTNPDTAWGKTFAEVKKVFLASISARRPERSMGQKTTMENRRKDVIASLKVRYNVVPRTSRTVLRQREQDALTIMSPANFVVRTGTDTYIWSRVRAWKLAKDELVTVFSQGIAAGVPGSTERTDQVNELKSGSRLPVSSRGAEVAAIQATSLAEGKSFYLKLASQTDLVNAIPNLLHIHLLKEQTIEDAFHPQIFDSRENLALAFNNLEKWISAFAVKKQQEMSSAVDDSSDVEESSAVDDSSDVEESSAVEDSSAIDDYWFEYMKEVEPNAEALLQTPEAEKTQPKMFKSNRQEWGTKIEVIPHESDEGLATIKAGIKWRGLDGVIYVWEDFVMPKSAMPKKPGDKRYFVFVPNGIDIRDSMERSLGVAAGKKVTVPLADLLNMVDFFTFKIEFWKLWEHQTGRKVTDIINTATGTETDSGTSSTLPVAFYRGRQEALRIAVGVKRGLKEALAALIPIQPGDGMWLWWRFLEEEYPGEGELDTTNPLAYRGMASVWGNLAEWCQKKRYKNHPHFSQMERLHLMTSGTSLENLPTSNNVKQANTSLRQALDLLRPPVVGRQTTKKNLVGNTASYKIYRFGAEVPDGVIDTDRSLLPEAPEDDEMLEDELAAQQVQVKGSPAPLEGDDEHASNPENMQDVTCVEDSQEAAKRGRDELSSSPVEMQQGKEKHTKRDS